MAQQNNNRGSLKAWNAQQNSSDNETVGVVTGGMNDDQKLDWLKKQVALTEKEMVAKGTPVDPAKVGTIFTDPSIGTVISACVDPACFEARTNGNSIGVNFDSVKKLTVVELRAALSHDIEHTQQGLPAVESKLIAGEVDADNVSVKTYGAKTTNGMLDKVYGGNPNRNKDFRHGTIEAGTFVADAPLNERKKHNTEFEKQLEQGQKQKPVTPPMRP